MLVSDLITAMESIAPLEFAEPWDKVGLLVGDRARSISGKVLLTIDLTESVLDEAVATGAGAIVAYHPPIFEALTKVTDATPRQRVILRAVEHKIAVYSPHTALDAVPGGVTDWLCEGLSGATNSKVLGDCRALTPHGKLHRSQGVKIVTFVPRESVDKVRNALASAGAGMIGDYQLCSFMVEGEGTFLGGLGTNPATGTPGKLEHAREVRLEMVCGQSGVPLAIETLRRFHPYEEPAIDVYELHPKPARNAGAGRRLVLDRPASVLELATRLKTFLKRERMRYALAPGTTKDTPTSHIGVVPGSGAELSKLARREGCEVFVTGEMKHHEVLGALNAGMSIIMGGHTSTERGYLARLKSMLESRLKGVETIVSREDVDPVVTI